MKVKFLFSVVAIMLFCFSISADDIYYRVNKSSTKKENKVESKKKPIKQTWTTENMSPEEFKKALAEFSEKSLNYRLDQLSKETIIGKLIRKKWYEFNPLNMQFNNQFYTEYTFTNRIYVGIDEDGNIIERSQKYYLSNKNETKFDSAKVGWVENGKYIVLQSNADPMRAISLHIENISDTELITAEKRSDNSKLTKFYAAVVDDKVKESPKVALSPCEMLIDKTWAEVDYFTGDSTRNEFYFEKFGYMEKCVMGENRRTSIPVWFIGEYYFSNEADTSYIYNKMDLLDSGRYIVNHIKDYDGKHVYTYEIKSTHNDTILLDCVYPANGKSIKLARIVRNNSNNTSTLDKLVGKQWRPKQERYDKYTYKHSHSGALYFSETQFVRPRAKTTDMNFIDERIYRTPYNYHLTDYDNVSFFFKEAEKKPQNGKYLVYGYDGQQGPYNSGLYEIMYISENMLVLRTRWGVNNMIYLCE